MAQRTQYHVYALPQELLATLTPRNLVNVPDTHPKASTPEPVLSTATAGQRSCNVCPGTVFLDLRDQRAHFRTDWHRYNVKTRLNGGNPANESAFSQLIDGEYPVSNLSSPCFGLISRVKLLRILCPVQNLRRTRTIRVTRMQSTILSTNQKHVEGPHLQKMQHGVHLKPPFSGSIPHHQHR
jgi:hypothetical protein